MKIFKIVRAYAATAACEENSYLRLVSTSGSVGGKTGKTSDLPVFSEIECSGGGSGSAPHCYGGLT